MKNRIGRATEGRAATPQADEALRRVRADHEKTKEPLPQRPRGPHPYATQISPRTPSAVTDGPSGADDACVLCGWWKCRCVTNVAPASSDRVLKAVA